MICFRKFQSQNEKIKIYSKIKLFYILILAGTIIMKDYINTDSHVDVQFEGFTSKLDILMYYIALSNNTDANSTDCKQYVSFIIVINV